MIPEYDSWKVVKKIGEGSFGAVYEIEKADFSHVKSALKVISIPQSESELLSVQSENMDTQGSLAEYYESVAADIVKEFEIMYKLHGNTNIVDYKDHIVKRHEDGIGYDIMIRMELLTSLDQYVLKHQMTRRDVIRLGIDMCQALERCQMFHIIHRDIKPANIFVSEQGDFKLGDFGIARTVEKHAGFELSHKGTYNYMAPEVYKGHTYGFDVDMYSLGLVMYRLLNHNRLPFMPPHPQKWTHEDRTRAIAMRMSGEEIPLPDQDHTRLGEIILKACSYDPQNRYSSPTAMKKDLEAILYSKEERDQILESKEDISIPPYGNSAGSSEALYRESVENARKNRLREQMEAGEESTVLRDENSDPDISLETNNDSRKLIPVILIFSALIIVLLIIFFNGPTGKKLLGGNHTINDETKPPVSQEGTEAETGARTETVDGDAGYKIVKEYDDYNNLIKEKQYHADGTAGLSYEYTYDDSHNKLSETVYHANGEIWKNYICEYENDLLKKQTEYVEGEMTQYMLYEWNADKTQKGYTVYLRDDTVSEIHQFTYNADGTYQEKTIAGTGSYLDVYADPNGQSVPVEIIVSEYDISDQLVKQSEYDKDETLLTYCLIKYDYLFRQTQQSWYFGDGSVEGHVEYEYSEDGNTTNQTMYDANGTILRYIKYENSPDGKLTLTQYDKDKSIVSQEVFDEEGNACSRDEYGEWN